MPPNSLSFHTDQIVRVLAPNSTQRWHLASKHDQDPSPRAPWHSASGVIPEDSTALVVRRPAPRLRGSDTTDTCCPTSAGISCLRLLDLDDREAHRLANRAHDRRVHRVGGEKCGVRASLTQDMPTRCHGGSSRLHGTGLQTDRARTVSRRESLPRSTNGLELLPQLLTSRRQIIRLNQLSHHILLWLGVNHRNHARLRSRGHPRWRCFPPSGQTGWWRLSRRPQTHPSIAGRPCSLASAAGVHPGPQRRRFGQCCGAGVARYSSGLWGRPV
mmetsp:Transcript_22675/g.57959  ORF Transcript_22675/g.57959 Transcript_22675/m.57959 type:complete len:272 (+) Transcript_22675:291-1106(+)